MTQRTFRLVYPLGDHEGTGATIEIDGAPVKGVRSVRIEAGVDKLTRVELELVDYQLDVDVKGDDIIDVTNLESSHRMFVRRVNAIGTDECKASVQTGLNDAIGRDHK